MNKEELKRIKEASQKNAEKMIEEETNRTKNNVRKTILNPGAILGNRASDDLTWAEMDHARRMRVIFDWLLILVGIAYIIVTAISPEVWGDKCVLSYVLSSPGKDADMNNIFVKYGQGIFGTIFYFFVIWGSSKIIMYILHLASLRGSKKYTTICKLIASTIKYVGAIIFLLIVLGAWGVDTKTILASAGVLALIVGLGAQSLIADVIAGLGIVFNDRYNVGDYVVIDNFRGVVQEIGISETKIIDGANNVKCIRNSQINTVVNLSAGLSYAVCDIGVNYNTDFDKLREVLEAELPKRCAKYSDIIIGPSYAGINAFEGSDILVRVVAQTPEAEKFGATRKLNEIVYGILVDNGFDIPFPHMVVAGTDFKINKKGF